VLNLAKDYRKNFNVLFINTGLLDKKDEDLLVSIVQTNNVSQLPSIALLDKEGKSYKVFEGIFDENEVKEILDGMVK
jgi:hydroxyethylthiazole kinase-like sugar kinase family protein